MANEIGQYARLAKSAFDDAGNIRPLKEQIRNYNKGQMPSGEMFLISGDCIEHLPGFENCHAPLIMKQSTLDKIRATHQISTEMLSTLPMLISESPLVLTSITEANARVIVLEAKDFDDNHVIAAVHLNEEKQGLEVNDLASVYGKESFARLMDNTRKLGEQIWQTSRTLAWAQGLENEELIALMKIEEDGAFANRLQSPEQVAVQVNHITATTIKEVWGSRQASSGSEIDQAHINIRLESPNTLDELGATSAAAELAEKIVCEMCDDYELWDAAEDCTIDQAHARAVADLTRALDGGSFDHPLLRELWACGVDSDLWELNEELTGYMEKHAPAMRNPNTMSELDAMNLAAREMPGDVSLRREER